MAEATGQGVGRPTKYLPEYCARVKELGALGYSVVEMAADIGVARSSIEEEWPEKHPEFSEAFTHARQLSQAWWERVGRENLLVPKDAGTFQASVWSRSMAARFPKDWRESKALTHEGPDGGPVRVENITRTIVDPAK